MAALLTSCAYSTNENNASIESITEIETEPSVETEAIEETVDPSDITYPIEYSDSSCEITITKEWFENAWCYIAHLEFTDYSRFGSALAHDAIGWYETASEAAERLEAIFCVNGAYMTDSYAIVRSGQVFYDTAIISDLAIYNSNTGMLESADYLGITGKLVSSAVKDGQVTDTFKFYNSTLVNNGMNVSNPNNYDRAQRTFMATTGKAGDIYIVVSEGRNADGESAGLTKHECAKLILELGCTYGVMLDGGGSSTMVWNGVVLNSAKDGQRPIVDFVYFK